MILRFFESLKAWVVDPEVPTRLLIQSSHVTGGEGLTFEMVAEESSEVRLWNVSVTDLSLDEYYILVGRSLVAVKLWPPYEIRRHWSLGINHEVSVVMSDFKPQ